MVESKDMPKAKEIVKSCIYASLATCDNGQPRVRPVSVFMVDKMSFLLATFSGSRKSVQMRHNPKVELCFVDSHHRQVRVAGTASLVNSVEEKGRLMKEYLDPAMWGSFFKGPEDPNFALFRIVPEQVEWMEQGQIKYNSVDLGE
jgi:general stress protein 26